MTMSPDPDTCFAFLIRHGATDSNLANPPVLQGRGVNGPLSAEGQRQAERAAACLSSHSLAAVYSSPLRRAAETAEHLAKPHGLPVNVISEISEVDVGAWERRSWGEICETDPELYQNFQNDPARHGYRDGENLSQVAERVIPAITSTMQAHLGEKIAIVGHNVVNRVFLAHAIDLPLARARGLSQENCGINTVRFRSGKFKAISINSIFHLFGESATSLSYRLA